jgi:hypothetical protein
VVSIVLLHLTKLQSASQSLLHLIELPRTTTAPSFHPLLRPMTRKSPRIELPHLGLDISVCSLLFLLFLLFLLSLELFLHFQSTFCPLSPLFSPSCYFPANHIAPSRLGHKLFVGPIHERFHERFHEPRGSLRNALEARKLNRRQLSMIRCNGKVLRFGGTNSTSRFVTDLWPT